MSFTPWTPHNPNPSDSPSGQYGRAELMTDANNEITRVEDRLVTDETGGGPLVVRLATAGPPTSGTWPANSTVFDSNGMAWYSAAGGTPGTWGEGPLVAKRPTDLYMSAFDTTAQGGDSTADFQAACNAAVPIIQTYGRCQLILDTKQHYYLKSPVTAGPNGEWSQVHLPHNGGLGVNSGSTWWGWFEIVGAPGGGTILNGQQPSGGTIIESTLTTAPAFNSAVGIASMFGTTASFQYTGPNAGSLLHSFIGISVKDVTLRQPANPPITCLDAGWSSGLRIDNVACAVPSTSDFNYTQPTSPQAVGVIYPFLTVWGYTRVSSLSVMGFYCGVYLGEISDTSLYYGQWNYINVGVDAANHGNRFGTLGDNQCPYGFASLDPASGVIAPISHPTAARGSGVTALFASPVIVGYWQQQQDPDLPAWANRVWDVYDPNSGLPLSVQVFSDLGDPIKLSPGCALTSVWDLYSTARVAATLASNPPGAPDFQVLNGYHSLVAGSTAVAYNASAYSRGGIRYNPSAAQNDGIIFSASVGLGQWLLTFENATNAAYGIITLDYSFDNGSTWTTLGTVDAYAATGTGKAVTTFTFINESGSAGMLLRARVLSKNASSTGYSYAISSATLAQSGTGWIPVTFNADWANQSGGIIPSQYRKNINGTVTIEVGATLSPGGGVVMTTLPPGFRPSATIIGSCVLLASGTYSTGMYQIAASGSVAAYTLAATDPVGSVYFALTYWPDQ